MLEENKETNDPKTRTTTTATKHKPNQNTQTKKPETSQTSYI